MEDEESEYYLYVDKMSNINDTKVVTPYIKALNGVDDFKFCWVVVAYDSTIDSLRNGEDDWSNLRIFTGLLETVPPNGEHYFFRKFLSFVPKNLTKNLVQKVFLVCAF